MEIEWNVVIGQAITSLLKVFVPVFAALIFKWAGDLWVKIKTTSPRADWLLETAAEIGYNVAEEFFRGKTGVSDQKLDYACEVAQNYLKDVTNVSIDLVSVKNAVINYGVSNHLFSWQEQKDDGNEQ